MTARRPLSALRAFLADEASGGRLLIAAAALALIAANSPLAPGYARLLEVRAGAWTLHHIVNDALMALFFLLVGLEIKRELADGHLARPADRLLPVLAAAGGMAVPAIVYLLVVRGDPALRHGWAIASATDIAFALAVLALLGRRVPTSLKLFLTTVAIADDVGAVAVIALVYTDMLDPRALGAAALILAAMAGLGRAGVMRLWPYLLLAAALWGAVLLSGVHPTVAGVLAALAIPLRLGADEAASPLHRLERGLHPWVAWGIVPLFGFVNAGVALGDAGRVLAPLPLGVAAGLVLGKQAGVFLAVCGAVAAGLAVRPAGASWWQLYGVALLCGIGFTMSLFIGALAFADPAQVDGVKLGVLLGSGVSALAGYAVLRLAR